MIFPKDEGVGDWKSGEIRIGKIPTLGKTFFEFLGKENTKKQPPIPHAAVFHLPSRLGMEKTFLEFELGIHARAGKQKQFLV